MRDTHSNDHFRNEKNVLAAKFLKVLLKSKYCTFLVELVLKEPSTTKSIAIDVRIILDCYHCAFCSLSSIMVALGGLDARQRNV